MPKGVPGTKKVRPTVVSPAIRLRHIETKLQRFLKLLKHAKRGNIAKACAAAGTSSKTFRRFKELYMSGGEDAVKRELGRKRGNSASVFMEGPGRYKRQKSQRRARALAAGKESVANDFAYR